jgi:hypothetical protein
MSKLSPKLVCPSCKGTQLTDGSFVTTGTFERRVHFSPGSKHMWVGYSPLYFVCCDCGYLGICLSEEERAKLYEKVHVA